MLLLYNFLSAISLLIYLPWLLLKKGSADKARFLSERLGLSAYSKTDIWVHAVSVGETVACLPFLKALKREFPEKKILLSTTTYTGQQVAREKFPEADRIMYMQWDTGLCVSRVVNSLRPEVFITIETELWPVLFHGLKKSGSHILLLNGRLSPKSFKGYNLSRFFMKEVLSYADFLYMQTKGDAERIIALGAQEEKVGIMGNFKFDIAFDKKPPLAWVGRISGRMFLAGSTHRGEDEIILDTYKTIKGVRGQGSEGKEFYNLKLIIAPRHPERFSEVEEIIKERGMNYIRRSEIKNATEADVILLDTIGELSELFSSASITFIGGSLLPYGGHNILEPAYWGNPILFGPHMENFPIAGEFLNRSAAIEVKNAKEIAAAVAELIQRPEKAKLMGENARAILDENKGAVQKALKLVRGYLGAA
ncbi:MAG: 3-deoxy-D-manno-octulosonic acid transferase [Nitrospirae bacterium]|nr:3-deoxy-D-manno-octulosonic acid transferase [Nitrospirota bacterium]